MPEQTDVPPKVDGQIGGSAVGAGYFLGQLSKSLTGDGGIRLLAFSAIASFTWVSSYALSLYMAMETERNALMTRAGEDRIEREKADRARSDKEQRQWMSDELEKQRTQQTQNITFIAKESASERERDRSTALGESEKNRALILKLVGAKIPGVVEEP